MNGWSFLAGGEKAGRLRRYIITMLLGWTVILVIVATVFFLSPRTYSSGFTLILPGAGPASTVNLESLGQASSSSNSPFGDHSLSPTENYKKLLQSYRLRGKVAEEMGVSIDAVPAPRISLVNQTKLMFVSVKGLVPAETKRLADTWLSVFEAEVQSLRTEEQTLREQAYQSALKHFEQAVEDTRADIIAFQSTHNLISIGQFQGIVEQSESLKLQLDEAIGEQSVAEAEIARLSDLLGLTPSRAADILALQSDPVFQALLKTQAAAEASVAESGKIYGPNHPKYLRYQEESAGARRALNERGRTSVGFEAFHRLNKSFYSTGPEHLGLVVALVEADTRLQGAIIQRETLQFQLQETQARVQALSQPATELDALQRDHQVAETVFASALARLDTNRTDLFASYPLTQIVETPTQPEYPISPSKKLMAIGTVGTLFIFTIGLGLLWIRLPIIRALLKTL